MPPSDAQAALSGTLPRGATAREIAVWIDTDCHRARALGTVGSSGRRFREKVKPEEPSPGPSPFATEAGARHEYVLSAPDEQNPDAKAALARHLYAEVGIHVPESNVEVLETESSADEDRRWKDEAQAQKTKEIVAAHRGDPYLVLQARLRFTLAGADHIVKPDVLLWTGKKWRVGEMKSYLDRGGYTDGASIAKAVKQCAIGAVALMSHVGEELVDTNVDLLLRRMGKVPASLRTLPADAEIEAVKWLDRHAPDEAARYLAMTGGRALDSMEALQAIPHSYGPECHGTCDLAETCEKEAATTAVAGLGAEAFAHLGVSNARAVELASGAEPASPAERALADVLRDGWNAATLT